MERVGDRQVGDVALGAGHPLTAAAAVRRRPDGHCGARWRRDRARRRPTARSAEGGRTRGCGPRTGRIGRVVGVRCVGGALDRLDDLLVPGAAAQVAGEALLDLRPGRVRVRAPAAPAATRAGPGCRSRTGRRPCRGTRRCRSLSRPPGLASPSTVMIVAPSASAARTRQESTDRAVEEHGAGAALADQRSTPSCRSARRSSRSASSSVCHGATGASNSAAVDRRPDRVRRDRAHVTAPRAPAPGELERAPGVNAKHREPVIGRRPHRRPGWRRVGEQRVKRAPVARARRVRCRRGRRPSSTRRSGRGPTLPYAIRASPSGPIEQQRSPTQGRGRADACAAGGPTRPARRGAAARSP